MMHVRDGLRHRKCANKGKDKMHKMKGKKRKRFPGAQVARPRAERWESYT